jgi:glycosyltransferase involved in cell wall biosynthesis
MLRGPQEQNEEHEMKVAMLTYSTRARGGVAHALSLAEHLRPMGADVTLHSLARRDDADSLRGYYRSVDAPHVIYPFEWHDDVMVRLERMIEAYVEGLPRDADIYHSQDCVGGTALHEMRRRGDIDAAVLRTVHHIDDFAEPRLFEFEKEAVKHADHRFVVSTYWKEALSRDYGLESTIVYNGIDLGEFDHLPERRSVEPTILFVGGFEPRKGLEALILALEQIRESIPDARLVVVAKTGFRGVDTEDWFRLLADRARVGDAVEFLQSIDQDRLLQCYSDSDVVALPSRNEGWGLSLMEAMACRKPVVATRVGGIPELVRDGVDGILVEPGDVAGLARATARVLRDEGLRSRMGAAGRDRVAGFTWDDAAKATMAVYARHAD